MVGASRRPYFFAGLKACASTGAAFVGAKRLRDANGLRFQLGARVASERPVDFAGRVVFLERPSGL